MPDNLTDTRPDGTVAAGASEAVTDPDELVFLRIYRVLTPTIRKALAASIDAAPTDRHQVTLNVLAEEYDQPKDMAQKAAKLGALLNPSLWKLPRPEPEGQ